MSREEVKYEINKVLDHLSDKALKELLVSLKDVDAKHNISKSFTASLNDILKEDPQLLARLAQ